MEGYLMDEFKSNVKQEADYKTKISEHKTLFVSASQQDNQEPVFWFSTTVKDDNKAVFKAKELLLVSDFINKCVEHFNVNYARPVEDKEVKV